MTQWRGDPSGPYVLGNAEFLREKANRDDPRRVFYAAMLTCLTYEDYLRQVGDLAVEPETYRSRPVTGRMEIQYARDHGWVRDAR